MVPRSASAHFPGALTSALGVAASAALLLPGCRRAADPPEPPDPPPAIESADDAGPDEAAGGPVHLEAAIPPPEIPPPPPEPPLRFGLPTPNEGLLRGEPSTFYMFVDRYTADGVVQKWEGGGYGMVRNPRDTPEGQVYTRFHEGIDIAPAMRDARGEPQDTVRAIADGTVVYATAGPRLSNYGNYVVVAHSWDGGGTFYSLYAHLREIEVDAGRTVRRGDALGQMGHTGDGIDRRRAHVHLELCLMLSSRFDEYNGKFNKLGNPHGNFHGTNLAGLDVATFLRLNHDDPSLMPDEFVRRQEVFFRVTVPNRGRELDLADRYPWLRQFGEPSASWEISFTDTGIPVMIAPSDGKTDHPVVTWTGPWKGECGWKSRGLLRGKYPSPSLSSSGARFVSLIEGDY